MIDKGMSPLSRVALALLSGVLLGLTFPGYNLWLLSWVAFIPFFMALDRASVRQAALVGLVVGIGWFGLTLPWVENSMINFGGVSLGVALLLNALLVFILALYPALFAIFFATTATHRNLKTAFGMAPFYWVAFEYLREHQK